MFSSSMVPTMLKEPRCEVREVPEDGFGYDVPKVRIAVHPHLVFTAPGVIELVRRWDVKEASQFVAEECLEDNDKDYEKAVACYFKKQEAV